MVDQTLPHVLVHAPNNSSQSFLSSIQSAGGAAIVNISAQERDHTLSPDVIVRIVGDPDSDKVNLLKKNGAPPIIVDTVGNNRLSANEKYPGQRIVEIVSIDEARNAAASGAVGVIARGNEAAGRCSDLSTFVLIQKLRSVLPDLTIWAQGGIGLYTTRAVMALGAHGVVLDEHVILLPGAGTTDMLKSQIESASNVRTKRIDGVRTVTPPYSRNNAENRTIEASETIFHATDYLKRFQTVRRVVRKFVKTFNDGPTPLHVTNWITDHRLPSKHPVIQGPMTRVSDQPKFARAVAADGGLPTIALGSLKPSDAQELLANASEELGDLPWAAGLLGFLPDKLIEAHMSLIEDRGPKIVILAGGNVEQARRMKNKGITVMLHCPSPILLRQMISDGHRNFIFEGNECGGHIGPKSSFALWEQQFTVLEKILRENDVGDIEITLAGGIHDSASAAAAMETASPLQTFCNLRINILLGTAYLFTEEAVAYGSITDQYQAELLKAQATTTITTAPGHTTRCLETKFVDLCKKTKVALQDEGKTDREIWASLEEMNLGRLRIAAKGVERRNKGLVSVDKHRQSSEGLFMAGEVAALHSSKTTIHKLHEAITDGAVRHLSHLYKRKHSIPPQDSREIAHWSDLAIVGMAGIFPGAPSLSDYWRLICKGVCEIGPVPKSRWITETFTSHDGKNVDGRSHSLSDRGAFLPPIEFDPIQFGIPPNSLAAIDPTQILALKVASDALEDWGYFEHEDGNRVSVIFGVESGGDLASSVGLRTLIPHYMGRLPREFDEVLPAVTTDSFPGMLANVCAGRIANRLDLRGLNCTVDAACGSSIAALNLAADELILGRCDVALAGAVDLHNAASDYVMFSSLGALSPTGEARVFDRSADGIVLGEGAGCLVLKRLADAERDGDPIHAVLRGIGTSSDGRALGLTAPRVDGQVLAFERAYKVGNIDRNLVGLIEAHGTGTAVGDSAEVTTIERIFEGDTRSKIRLGSVKAQIGHTKCAAGMAGVIKAALCVEMGVFPVQPALSTPLPEWNPGGRILFQDRTVPWTTQARSRVAGISAFGFGGTNYHAVITGYEGSEPELNDGLWSAELVIGWGSGLEDAITRTKTIMSSQHPADSIRYIAQQCWNSRRVDSDKVQFAIVTESKDRLREQIDAIEKRGRLEQGVFLRQRKENRDGHIVGLFPGQGSQSVNMMAELFSAVPFAARRLQARPRVADAIYPGRAFSPESTATQKDVVTDTTVAQPALVMCSVACLDIARRSGLVPQHWIGHSLGELTALYAAGAVTYEEVLKVVEARATVMNEVISEAPGAMLAVASDAHEVSRTLKEASFEKNVTIANDNSPHQVVLSGDEPSVMKVKELLRGRGVVAKRLNVAGAFHSRAMKPAAAKLQTLLEDMNLSCESNGSVVWANRTASPYNFSNTVKEISSHLHSPVRFTDSIRAVRDAGASVFVELGPKSVLSQLVQSTLTDDDVLCTGVEKHGTGIVGLLSMFAELLVEGINLDLGWIFDDRAIELKGNARNHSVTLRDGRFWSSRGDLLTGSMRPADETQIDLTQSHRNHPVPLGNSQLDSQVEEYQDGSSLDNRRELRNISDGLPYDGITSDISMTVSEEWWEDMMEVKFDDKFIGSYGGQSRSNIIHAYLENMGRLGSEQARIVELALSRRIGGLERDRNEVLDQSSALHWPESTGHHELERRHEDITGLEPQPSRPAVAEMLSADEDTNILVMSEGSESDELIAAENPTVSSDSTSKNVESRVKNVISEITGYPVEMIDEGIDLETDLSIDSIKRMEVAGALLDDFGLERDRIESQALEELSSARSVSTVSHWIRRQLDSVQPGSDADPVFHQSSAVGERPEDAPESKPTTRIHRYVMDSREQNLL